MSIGGPDALGEAQVVGIGLRHHTVGDKQVEHFGQAQPVFMNGCGT